jgi:hypothetical protein
MTTSVDRPEVAALIDEHQFPRPRGEFGGRSRCETVLKAGFERMLSVHWLSKPFASGLFADAEHGPDLRPGPTVCARLGDLIGEP